MGFSYDDEENEGSGFRAILKRHKESQLNHIERIRKNLPASSNSRQRPDINIQPAGTEEIMRLKNELAIQRALRNAGQDKVKSYKSSAKAMKYCGFSNDTENSQGEKHYLPTERV